MGEQEQSKLRSARISDYQQAARSNMDRAMLDYAAKLTEAPATVGQSDVEQLRAEGFDDRGMHDWFTSTS